MVRHLSSESQHVAFAWSSFPDISGDRRPSKSDCTKAAPRQYRALPRSVMPKHALEKSSHPGIIWPYDRSTSGKDCCCWCCCLCRCCLCRCSLPIRQESRRVPRAMSRAHFRGINLRLRPGSQRSPRARTEGGEAPACACVCAWV